MLETFNLTVLGAIHTLLALIAIAAGVISLLRFGEIGSGTRTGLVYIVFTAATAITGLFIFRHGGFGAPHVLSILTLLALAIAYAVEKLGTLGGLSRHVVVVSYSLTLFFHLIPGLNETGSRLPLGHPLISGPDDPAFKAAAGAGFLVFLAGAALQVLRIRRSRKRTPSLQRI
jgi:uncharacterized membrane protein